MKLKIKKIREGATVPSFVHHDDAGMDFFAAETVTVAPGGIAKIPSGLSLEIPKGYVGLCWDKSGLSMNFGIKVMGGVIDSGFRGEFMMGVINLSNVPYTFEKGHKVLQMLIQKVERPKIVETKELAKSKRGKKGFGSSGK